jgi:hypothetical protein
MALIELIWKTLFPTQIDTKTEMPDLEREKHLALPSHILSLRDSILVLEALVGSDLKEAGSLRESVSTLVAAVKMRGAAYTTAAGNVVMPAIAGEWTAIPGTWDPGPLKGFTCAAGVLKNESGQDLDVTGHYAGYHRASAGVVYDIGFSINGAPPAEDTARTNRIAATAGQTACSCALTVPDGETVQPMVRCPSTGGATFFSDLVCGFVVTQ